MNLASKKAIDALSCRPGQHDRIVFDDHITGFGLRVTAKTKTFILQYQFGGRSRRPDTAAGGEPGGRRERLVLGRYGDITPTEARRRAEKARGLLSEGRNPAAEARAASADAARQATVAAYTFARLVDDWAETALARRASPRYRAEAPAVIRRTFAALLDRPAHQLDRRDVREITTTAEKAHPIGTRRAISYARAAYNWAMEECDLAAPGNPFQRLLRGHEASRDRVLSDAELGEAWRAAGTLPPPFGPYVQLLILTLQRRGELAGMQWDELAPDRTTWTVPASRAKNGVAHVVHLTEAAQEILRQVPRRLGVALVFAAVRRRSGPVAERTAPAARRSISGFSDGKDRLFAAIRAERARLRRQPLDKVPAPDWRLHDLRRTGVTRMAQLGVAPHVADRILNHVHGSGTISGVAAVYQRAEFLAERAVAMQLWTDHVLAVAATETGRAPAESAADPTAPRAPDRAT